jgi:hypothetical protein
VHCAMLGYQPSMIFAFLSLASAVMVASVLQSVLWCKALHIYYSKKCAAQHNATY